MAGSNDDIATVAGVQAYIVDTPFDSTSVVPLSGGYGNYAYRLILREPFREQDTVVLKHAKPYAAAFKDMPFSLERQVTVCVNAHSTSVSLTTLNRRTRSRRCARSAQTCLPTRSSPCRRCSGSTTRRM